MTLIDWQRENLPWLQRMEFAPTSLERVTLLSYFFYDDERIETEFWRTEFAFLCSYHVFGVMPSVLVVNQTTKAITDFSRRFDIELQVDPSLTGGLSAMNLDCDAKLYSRFKADYVLTIESDGMPVNAGLEQFLEYDYVGAPWQKVRQPWYLRPFHDYLVGNSGFCLRSKKICKMAADFYAHSLFRILPYNFLTVEDVFYCKTMRWFGGRKMKSLRFPDPATAARFSLEYPCDYFPASAMPPIGFHGAAGFENYVNLYGIPQLQEVC